MIFLHPSFASSRNVKFSTIIDERNDHEVTKGRKQHREIARVKYTTAPK